ncbi:MAG: DUF4421 domain-containing protein [Prevotella sp.]|nr:DUF4421 domain-containing protein [Prevotella sp.]
MRFAMLVLCLMPLLEASAHTPSVAQPADTVAWMRPGDKHKPSIGIWMLRRVGDFLRAFNDVDTSYIEPQRYNFTVMMQSTTTYEMYRLGDTNGQSVTLAPEFNYRIGPYLGYRWVFLGYTVDISHMHLSSGNKQRKEYDFSLYSALFGIDFYYRKTGNDYKIRDVRLANDMNTSAMKGIPFGGLTSSIKGFNAYYIFNHHRFSYPAAFSQSTVQRRSAGSWLAGLGYTNHTLLMDWQSLNSMMEKKLGETIFDNVLDSTLQSGKVKYTDMSLSVGYAYNWVFTHNWLLAASLSVALAYNQSQGQLRHKFINFKDFSSKNVNLDGIGRFGLVYNNSRWYAGLSAIFHAYNYRRANFSTNNIFGNINLYVGFNFGRRKH